MRLSIMLGGLCCGSVARCVSPFKQTKWPRRSYARPAHFSIPAKVAFKPPPPPPPPAVEPATVEDGHGPGEAQDAFGPFDDFLAKTAQSLRRQETTSVAQLHTQYLERGGRMCNHVVPYNEKPLRDRRADASPSSAEADGIVMVVHALFKLNGRLDKICACSGFVVDTQSADRGEQGQVVITCAHTLEEMYRNVRQAEDPEKMTSMSFVVPSHGPARRVSQILSSMPRSDTIAMQLEPQIDTSRLRALPLSPFPVYNGMTVLTHLFDASAAPVVTRSQSRLPKSAKDQVNREQVERPVEWLSGQAWRRWGVGHMLGYRSYTNIEVEAGIHSSLPHILTSVLPTPGSSGGPLVCYETGAVVGMTSGRRMDNRVEGERGWGASSESIFEMFTLPGFMPSGNGLG